MSTSSSSTALSTWRWPTHGRRPGSVTSRPLAARLGGVLERLGALGEQGFELVLEAVRLGADGRAFVGRRSLSPRRIAVSSPLRPRTATRTASSASGEAARRASSRARTRRAPRLSNEVAGGAHTACACLATSASCANAGMSFTARSARTLRLIVISADLRPEMSAEYDSPWMRAAALMRVIQSARNSRFLVAAVLVGELHRAQQGFLGGLVELAPALEVALHRLHHLLAAAASRDDGFSAWHGSLPFRSKSSWRRARQSGPNAGRAFAERGEPRSRGPACPWRACASDRATSWSGCAGHRPCDGGSFRCR